MSKTSADRRAARGVKINLFDSNISLGWRVIYQVRLSLALEKVAARQWREVWLTNGELAGVQPLPPKQQKTLHQILVEHLIAVTITLAELERNAGLYGRSHTLGMSEWKRLRRHVVRRGQPVEPGGKPVYYETGQIADPEDATELAIEKVRLWPYPASVIGTDKHGKPVFGDRAVRVYPHPPQRRGPVARDPGSMRRGG